MGDEITTISHNCYKAVEKKIILLISYSVPVFSYF